MFLAVRYPGALFPPIITLLGTHLLFLSSGGVLSISRYLWTQYSVFMSYLLYSCILLTCMSNILSKLSSTPQLCLTHHHNFSLLSLLICVNSFNALSSFNKCFKSLKFSMCNTQSSFPIFLVKNSASLLLQHLTHLLGVTPLVLF